MPVAGDLEPKYYFHHFNYVLDLVQKQYSDLLSSQELKFIARFEEQSEDARCLYIRLANRRPVLFRTRKLNYPEIEDIDACLEQLEAAGLIGPPQTEQLSEPERLLALFTKAELIALLNLEIYAKLRRSELIPIITAQFDPTRLLSKLNTQEHIISIRFEQEVRMIKFLFFGSVHRDMEQFVIRDLGQVHFESFSEHAFSRYFQTRKQAEDKLCVYLAHQEFKTLASDTDIQTWFNNWRASYPDLDAIVTPQLDRLSLGVAKRLEQTGDLESALQIYGLADCPPARERRVRLLHKLKQTQDAEALCLHIINQPYNAEELLFAKDFLQRLSEKRFRLSTTQALNSAQTINLEHRYRHCVEQGILDHYAAQGQQGLFTENILWQGLLGLLLWDVLFDQTQGAIHHPFQRSPSDLYRPEFFTERHDHIMQRLSLLNDPGSALLAIQSTLKEKWGIANPLVTWHSNLPTMIEACCTHLSGTQLHDILLAMVENIRHHTRGFPDLLIWDDQTYCLIEVKSPTDHLSAQQLWWLNFFSTIKVNAQIIRVEWQFTD